MGKQINFFMDYETEAKFFEYLLPQCKISNKVVNGEMIFIDTLPERFSGQDWFQLHLYKPEMGPCDIVIHDDGKGYVNAYSSYSPVIEFCRSVIRTDDKIITRGRLYVVMKYYDKDDNNVSKPEELNKWYNELCRWIRKHLPRREYENPISLEYANRMCLEYGVSPGHMTKEYISDSILRLVQEEGYHTS
jgi:hypothetical protein